MMKLLLKREKLTDCRQIFAEIELLNRTKDARANLVSFESHKKIKIGIFSKFDLSRNEIYRITCDNKLYSMSPKKSIATEIKIVVEKWQCLNHFIYIHIN
jgi:hypothetical protein